MQKSGDIVFTEAETNMVHHPYEDALVVTAKIANIIIHRMLVDNGSTTNILFWDAYQKIRLTWADLSLMTTPLYGFTMDHLILEGTIKLVVTLGEHTVVTEFLTVNYPSVFNEVIGRPLLRALKVAMSVHCLLMKFLTTMGTSQV